jgi:hypothetical protein
MRLQKTFYQKHIITDKYKSLLIHKINRVSDSLHNTFHPITIKNNNSYLNTVITTICQIPIIPFGLILLARYKKKLKVRYNKYYSLSRYKRNIKILYGYDIINKSIW